MAAEAEKSAEAGAPGKEIEITPEMIEAGDERVCRALLLALERNNPSAFIAFDEHTRETAIDGHFDLSAVFRDAFSQQKETDPSEHS